MNRKRKEIIPIQIIGTQRSGSNLLRLMLNQLNEISAPHPPHILKTFVPLESAYGDLESDKTIVELIEDVCKFVEANPVKWEGVQLDRKQICQRINERNIYEIFRVIYEMHAASKNCTYWCCKSMANVRHSEQLERNGTKPFYIHLYRDGRDVALSFKKVLVGEKHMYSQAEKWYREQLLSLRLFDKLGAKRVIQISYESLLTDTENQMKRLCDFLHIDFTEKVFEYYNSRESELTADSGEMWNNVRRPLIRENHGKYLSELTKQEILIFESVAGSMLDKLGYPIKYAHNGYKLNFSEQDIEKFSQENIMMKEQALKSASPHDIQQRSAQNRMIKGIKAKLFSPG